MGKSTAGGLDAGLFMTEYAETPPLNTVENEPTVRGIKIAIIRALLSLIFIVKTRFSYLLKLYEKRAVNMNNEMHVCRIKVILKYRPAC